MANLEQIGAVLAVTRERVRQIQQTALNKLAKMDTSFMNLAALRSELLQDRADRSQNTHRSAEFDDEEYDDLMEA